MTALKITVDTPDWHNIIAAHLNDGEDAYVEFKPNGYNAQQLAEKMGLTKQAIIYYIKTNRLAATRFGHRYNISAEEADDFIKWYNSGE